MRVNRVVPPSPLAPTTPTSPVRSPKKAARVQIQPTGPPLVPTMIVDNIMQYTARIKFRKKLHFLLAVCRYWSLKRDARRGAPLLKRLHLEVRRQESSMIHLNQLINLHDYSHGRPLRRASCKLMTRSSSISRYAFPNSSYSSYYSHLCPNRNLTTSEWIWSASEHWPILSDNVRHRSTCRCKQPSHW
jgi:hypothetical protein